MSFTVALRGEPRRPAVIALEPEEPKELLDVLAAATDELHEASGVEFVVSGFGQERWPLDVRFDLLDFLSDLEWIAGELSRGADGAGVLGTGPRSGDRDRT